jgi:hypothetical protein
MIPILIFAISFVASLQFFISYCHSIMAQLEGHDLSELASKIPGITERTIRSQQFARLRQLIELCPEPGSDANQVRAISAYFAMLGGIQKLLRSVASAPLDWIEFERDACARAVAVLLDLRIAHNRVLAAQQNNIL